MNLRFFFVICPYICKGRNVFSIEKIKPIEHVSNTWNRYFLFMIFTQEFFLCYSNVCVSAFVYLRQRLVTPLHPFLRHTRSWVIGHAHGHPLSSGNISQPVFDFLNRPEWLALHTKKSSLFHPFSRWLTCSCFTSERPYTRFSNHVTFLSHMTCLHNANGRGDEPTLWRRANNRSVAQPAVSRLQVHKTSSYLCASAVHSARIMRKPIFTLPEIPDPVLTKKLNIFIFQWTRQ